MSTATYVPIPVFDTIEFVMEQYKNIYQNDNPKQIIRDWLSHCFSKSTINVPSFASKDYEWVLKFLYSYRGSPDTFNAYRRDLERLIQWSWFVREQSILKHKREDIETFLSFCIKPYKRWIGIQSVARFKNVDGIRISNPKWRPFDVKVNKKEHRAGIEPDKNDFQFSQQALKASFAILSSFYNFILQEEVVQANPVILIRQKSKFIRQQSGMPIIRRLSETQWQTVIQLTKKAAAINVKYERDVFILSCLYGMYLRISELVASERWTPTMGDFVKDGDNNWWFKTVGKGNKERKIAVSPAMISALKQYRKTFLGLPPFPSINENTPLISHKKNSKSPITSERPIRQLVQECFNRAATELEMSGDKEEAASLRLATVHWLRHTGISDDVKIRPREHVRDDAGHNSSATTDRYIDVELKERARSARKKIIGD